MPLSSLQKQDFGLILSFWGLSAVLVPMRVLARMSSRFSFGLDDYLLWVAFVFNTIEMAICVAVTCLGQGKSQTEVSQKNIVIVLKMQLASQEVYMATIMLVKSSILILYGRLFVSRGFRRLSWAVFFVVFAWYLYSTIFVMFQCRPLRKVWDSEVPGSCNLRQIEFFTNAVPNTVTDIFMLLMPIVHVWRLHASFSYRVSLMMVLMQGSFVVFCSIYRLVTLFSIKPQNYFATMSRPITWASVEASAAVVSACLPTLRPLLARIFHLLGIPVWVQKSGITSATPNSGTPAGRKEPSVGAVTKLYRHYDSNLESLLRPEEELGIPENVITARRPDTADDGLPLNDIRVDKGVYWEVSETSSPRQ